MAKAANQAAQSRLISSQTRAETAKRFGKRGLEQAAHQRLFADRPCCRGSTAEVKPINTVNFHWMKR